ncbi:MAG: regulatory protein ArsR [Frankiales bacterium]|nr:regulatory protein ArsR [Frankiales bacterium]
MKTNAAPLFDALGDPSRRAILELVAHTPRPVGELADALPISRPAVSQHLKVLKDVGLVTVRTEGTRHLYAMDPTGLAPVRAWFARFWNDNLAAFASAVEED